MFCLKQTQLIHESLWNNLQYIPIHIALILYHKMGQTYKIFVYVKWLLHSPNDKVTVVFLMVKMMQIKPSAESLIK